MKQKTNYLDEAAILQILEEILYKEPCIKYLIKVSKTSLSIYIRFFYDSCFVTRRISDHTTSSKIKTLLVSKSTKYKHVEMFIKDAVKILYKNHKQYLINQIKSTLSSDS